MDEIKVLVLGYYHRNNLGDDTFEYIFEKYFEHNWPNCQLIIKNTDDIEEIPSDTSLIICGGGDIINPYFIEKIKELVEPIIDRVPIYAIGVGFPYLSYVNDKKPLDIFDIVIHRNKQYHDQISLDFPGQNRIHYFPDLAFHLPHENLPQPNNSPSYQTISQIKASSSKSTKHIGIFLARPIYHPNNPNAYQEILNNMADFIVQLAQQRKDVKWYKKRPKCLPSSEANNAPLYQIYFLPCCTTNDSQKEDDRIINQDLYDLIYQKDPELKNIHQIKDKLEVENIISIFQLFDITICTRFHAHIFSIIAKVPFLSIYTSNKVQNLLETHNLTQYAIKMETDPEYYYPTSLKYDQLVQKFQKIIEPTELKTYQNLLSQILTTNQEEIEHMPQMLNNLIWTPIKYQGPETKYFQHLTQLKTNEIAHKIVQYAKPELEREQQEVLATRLCDVSPERLRVHQLFEEESVEVEKHLAEMISFILTGNRVTDFNYGLQQQILTSDYHLHESVKWMSTQLSQYITNEHIINNPVTLSQRKFDMKYFNQRELQGFHRSGWSYVCSYLELFHNSNGPIFDSFLDRTFGWNYEFYKSSGIIPFKKQWVGIFHHTQNETYTQNNLVEVFKKPLFLTSLVTCKGIYVLSNYLKEWLTTKLSELDFGQIPVEVLIHPTEIIDQGFDFQAFLQNPDKKVIQVGAWYRNSYAIYQISSPRQLRKCALKGKYMENYYLNNEQYEDIRYALYQIGNSWSEDNQEVQNKICRLNELICRPNELVCRPNEQKCNKYLTGLISMIEQNHQSVQILDFLTNQEYDELLAKNIVFINLIDASAVNTVIECIVRRTPIVINRLPAVEEYLGENYPLYYSSLNEAEDKLNDFELLEKGHEYMMEMDISRFHINHFLDTFVNSEIYQSI